MIDAAACTASAISKYSVNLLMALGRLTFILNSHACKNKKIRVLYLVPTYNRVPFYLTTYPTREIVFAAQ